MNAHGFTSVFAPQIEAYLAFKQKMGFYGSSRVWYLKRFDAYCAEHDRQDFDRDTVEGWVREQLTHSGRYRSWMSYIRDFGRWLAVHEDTNAYVPSERWKAPFIPAHPYLLTTNEIELSFTAAAHLHSQSPWRWQAVAFFTLRHSCGLRTGETRALLTEHVDLSGGHIDVLWSKGQPQPQAAPDRRGHRCPGRLRSGISSTLRLSANVLRLRRREPGHPRLGRDGVQPRLGPSQADTADRRDTTAPL